MKKKLHDLLVLEEAKAQLAELKGSEIADEYCGITLDQVDPNSPRLVPCVLEYAPGEFAFAPGISFLFGLRGTLKTWLAYFAVLQEVRRGNWALILDYELSAEESGQRMYDLGATREELSRVRYLHPSGPPSAAGRAKLLEQFNDAPPSLVILDSAGMGMAIAGLDENKSLDVGAWSSLLMWLKAEWADTVILVIDHIPKGSASATDPIGSQRKGALADALYLVTKLGEATIAKKGSSRLTVHKARKGAWSEGTNLLDFSFGGGDSFEVKPSDPNKAAASGDLGEAAEEMRKVAVYVGGHEGVTVEVCRTEVDIHPNRFTAIKKVLVSKEVIVHTTGKGLFKGTKWAEYVEVVEGFAFGDG